MTDEETNVADEEEIEQKNPAEVRAENEQQLAEYVETHEKAARRVRRSPDPSGSR